jgi:glycosyltransferase involved in cell wall biosynthesis
MSRSRPLLSIVCPAFQEEEVLPLFHKELAAVLDRLEADWRAEVIYVDDGSVDRTLPVLKEMAAADRRIRYFSLSRNFGHQAALTAGMEQARGDIVISMDSDLQHPPEVIPALLEKWREGFDVVLTIRAEDQRLSLTKRLTSKLFYRIMGALSSTDIRMSASDFRLMSRPALNALLRLQEHHRFLRGMVQWIGFRSAEIHFHPRQRQAGKTKYTLRRMLRLAGDGLFSFSTAPLRLATYLGAIALCMGAAHTLWLAVTWLFGSSTTSTGWHYLMVSAEIMGGAILCGLGTVGTHVGRIFEQVKERPLYLVKELSKDLANVPPVK